MPVYVPANGEGLRETVVPGHVTNSIEAPGADGLTIDGRTYPELEIEDHVFSFGGIPRKDQDEVLSGVRAPVVYMRRCLIMGGIKAILAGNSDHLIADFGQQRWHLEDCAIIYAGRRCPEAQDGTTVTMRRCWVHDWGAEFDVRAFGAWAHRGGKILAEDCAFTQSGPLPWLGPAKSCADILAHAGQAVKDGTVADLLRWRTWLPGPCRGLTADTGGLVLANRCWKNRWWIRLENANNDLDRQEGLALIGGIIYSLSMTDEVAQHALALHAIKGFL